MTAHAIEGCDHMTTGDGSNPADFGTMQLFTLQGIMTFLCVFGWTGIICTSLGLHVAIAIIIALVLGFLAMLGVAKVLQFTRKLTQDGSLDVRRLLGEKGRVYIPIPANASGEGKVTIAAGERFIELSAVTDEQETIPTGTQVRIRELGNASLFANLLRNKVMIGVFALMFALQVLVVQFGGAMFRTVPLPIDMWLKIIAVGFGVVVLQEVIKTVKRAAAAIRARRTANESDSQQPHQPIALDLVD